MLGRSSGEGIGYPLKCPWASLVAQLIKNPGDLGAIPGLGRSPGEGQGYLLQYSALENSMNFLSLEKVYFLLNIFPVIITPVIKLFFYIDTCFWHVPYFFRMKISFYHSLQEDTLAIKSHVFYVSESYYSFTLKNNFTIYRILY